MFELALSVHVKLRNSWIFHEIPTIYRCEEIRVNVWVAAEDKHCGINGMESWMRITSVEEA